MIDNSFILLQHKKLMYNEFPIKQIKISFSTIIYNQLAPLTNID